MPKTDNRYTIGKEFCGYKQEKYILRFCGDWLSWHETEKDAREAMRSHIKARII